MPQSKIEEFSCSDGSSGIIVDDQLIYSAECSAREWSSNYRLHWTLRVWVWLKEENMNELNNLKSLVGEPAFIALLEGCPLQIWRRSSPHNWFIEKAEGGGFLWHSDDRDRRLPNLALFDKLKDSDERILQYWGRDAGMPERSFYVLKRKPQGVAY